VWYASGVWCGVSIVCACGVCVLSVWCVWSVKYGVCVVCVCGMCVRCFYVVCFCLW